MEQFTIEQKTVIKHKFVVHKFDEVVLVQHYLNGKSDPENVMLFERKFFDSKSQRSMKWTLSTSGYQQVVMATPEFMDAYYRGRLLYHEVDNPCVVDEKLLETLMAPHPQYSFVFYDKKEERILRDLNGKPIKPGIAMSGGCGMLYADYYDIRAIADYLKDNKQVSAIEIVPARSPHLQDEVSFVFTPSDRMFKQLLESPGQFLDYYDIEKLLKYLKIDKFRRPPEKHDCMSDYYEDDDDDDDYDWRDY